MADEATEIRAAANQRLAVRLLSMLSTYQHENLPEKRGRFVLTCRIFSCRLGDKFQLSYRSNTALGELLGLLAHIAFLSDNEKAGTEINRISEAVQGRYNTLEYRSRQAYRGRSGDAVLVLFKDHAEVRLSPPLTASVQAFLSGNTACTSSGMSHMVRLEREGDGRYVVFDSETAGTARRIGVVLGGNGKWLAESKGGETFSGRSARAAALQLTRANLSSRTDPVR